LDLKCFVKATRSVRERKERVGAGGKLRLLRAWLVVSLAVGCKVQ
jgi:hypothetical protein